MTDMIERLRAPYYWMSGGNCDNEEEDHTPFEAANEIERLRNRVAYLEFVSRTVQGEQIKLAADLMQEKIVSDRLRAALAPLVELAGAIRDDAEKATPGPWVTLRAKLGGDVGITAPDCSVVAEFFEDIRRQGEHASDEAMHNGYLTAALRNAVPAILAAADAAGGEG